MSCAFKFTYFDLFENLIENKSNSFINLERLILITTNDTNALSVPDNNRNTEVVETPLSNEEQAESLIEESESKSSITVDEGLQLYWKGIYHESEQFRYSQPGIAKNYFQKAAEKGNTESLFHINYYMKSDYARKSFLESEVKNDNTEAQFLLGEYYRNKKHYSEREHESDDQFAKPLLEKAALKGHIPAQYELGRWYANNYKSSLETVIGSWTYHKYYPVNDYENAIKWIRKAADAGFPPAQMKLGYYYTEGKGVQKDLKQAFDWYLKAAMQGYDEATYEIGKRYHKGIGVVQDLNKAIEWYKKSNAYLAKSALKNLGVK